MNDVGVAILIAVVLLAVIGFVKRFLSVCPPNEVLIFSGRKHTMADGTERPRVVAPGCRPSWRP